MRVKFWTRSALEHSIYVISAAVVYGLLTIFVDMEGDWSEGLDLAAGYLVAMAAILELCLCGWLYKQSLPLVLSFGATRKEAFVGLQCHRLVYNGLVFLLAAALAALSEFSGPAVLSFLLLMLGVLLTAAAISAVLGAVYVRFGGKAVLLFAVGIVVLAALVTIGIVKLAINGTLLPIPAHLWPFPAVGAVLWGLSMIPEYRAIRNYTVKM